MVANGLDPLSPVYQSVALLWAIRLLGTLIYRLFVSTTFVGVTTHSITLLSYTTINLAPRVLPPSSSARPTLSFNHSWHQPAKVEQMSFHQSFIKLMTGKFVEVISLVSSITNFLFTKSNDFVSQIIGAPTIRDFSPSRRDSCWFFTAKYTLRSPLKWWCNQELNLIPRVAWPSSNRVCPTTSKCIQRSFDLLSLDTYTVSYVCSRRLYRTDSFSSYRNFE